MRKIVFLFVLLCCFLIISCGGPSTNREATNTSAPAASPAATTATTATTPTASAEKIGVAECDEYLAAYDACISSKVPESARAQYRTAMDQQRSSWRSLAANPQTKASLAAACKTAIEQARTSMKTFDCKF